MPDFECYETPPEDPIALALQLAQDRLAQTRGCENLHLWDMEEAANANLVFCGSRNGQPLLHAPGGEPFTAGHRDSNGALRALCLPGDIVIYGNTVRVGGMPRVKRQAIAVDTQGTVTVAVLFEKTTTTTTIGWLKLPNRDVVKVWEVDYLESTILLGYRALNLSWVDGSRLVAQVDLGLTSEDPRQIYSVSVVDGAIGLTGFTDILPGSSSTPFAYPSSFDQFNSWLVPRPNTDNYPLDVAGSFGPTARTGYVGRDGNYLAFLDGEPSAGAGNSADLPTWQQLRAGVRFGVAQTRLTSTTTAAFPSRIGLKLTDADIALMGISSGEADVASTQFSQSGALWQVVYQRGIF